MSHTLPVLDIAEVTHDVRRIRLQKPDGYKFVPGQATEVAVDKDGWREEKRPFTFTCLPEDTYLEFTIKIYPDHDGVTGQIGKLHNGDHLILEDPWGTIQYKGKGCFVAGGAGITPFIAIIRDLKRNGELEGNTLIFSNKAERDIILRKEFEQSKELKCLFTVTDQPNSDLPNTFIDKGYLQKHIQDFRQNFYVCGPPPMMDQVMDALKELGADPDSLTFEE